MIDTHAHLNDPKFASDLNKVVARARAAGVDRIVVCGYDLPSSRAAIEIASRFESVFATVGVHPHDAKSWDGAAREELRELARAPKVIGIGETGLDFHYDFSPRAVQIEALEAHIELAHEAGLPIVVHSREAGDRALQVLESRASNVVGGVFHCFSGDEDFARRVLQAGFYIGIDGPVTFANAALLRGVVRITPLERILIETDCPYLAPVPHRGKRNEPAYLVHIADEVARIKGVPVEEIDRVTSENARRLFGRLS